MPKASVAQSPEDRNKALLCAALEAGKHVTKEVPGGAFVTGSDPGTRYLAGCVQNSAGAWVEDCTCPAMRSPVEGGYRRAVVRWRTPDGIKHNNGVTPCSHILIARFHRQWLAADGATRAVIVASVPGLAAALVAEKCYYKLEA